MTVKISVSFVAGSILSAEDTGMNAVNWVLRSFSQHSSGESQIINILTHKALAGDDDYEKKISE